MTSSCDISKVIHPFYVTALQYQQNVNKHGVNVWSLSWKSLSKGSFYRVWNKQCMHCHDEKFLDSLEYHFGVHFLRCFVAWEMHTKVIIEQAHRDFDTLLHVLFFKSFLDVHLQPRITDTLRVPHIVRASLFLAHIAEGNCFFILVKLEEIHWNHRIIIWCSVLI